MSTEPDCAGAPLADSHAINIQTVFEQGLAAGLDPDSPARPPTFMEDPGDRKTITNLRSRWLHQRCKVCGHSFRLSDEVLIRGNGRVVHDMLGLRCGGERAGEDDANESEDRAQFFMGLDAAWPMPADAPVVLLEAGHPLLAPPLQGHSRASCRVCGHTFRPYDQVVVCPCSPHAPRCQAAVHRDLLRQLHCWDEWMRRPKGLKRKGENVICLGMS